MDRCAIKNLRRALFYESLLYNLACLSRSACEAEEELDELLLSLTFRRRPLLEECCRSDWDYKCNCRE